MTRIILILFTLLTLFSCKQGKNKSIEETANPSDTTCIKEIKKAKKDLSKKIIVYCNYVGNIIWQDLRAEKEMDSLLKLHNIKYEDESSPCVIEENKNYHCYCEYMQEQINSKFGSRFTDSLLYIADSLYILKTLTIRLTIAATEQNGTYHHFSQEIVLMTKQIIQACNNSLTNLSHTQVNTNIKTENIQAQC